MHRKLTISLDEAVYEGLYRFVGRRKISRFIEELILPYVQSDALLAGYREMAADEEAEREALEWSEAVIGDIADETW
ncbi:MAG: addiction module antitoxin [Deltaproteobacteria bacterium]|nr:addiction module antitoxin [Deltaproteobacteria bacterium]